MNKVGIFGIGKIGSVLVKHLHQIKSNQYFYFNRSNKTEIKIKYQDTLSTISICLSESNDIKLDWLIVCIKEYHYKEAMPEIIKLINHDTKIAVFRNGLRLSSNLIDIASDENILETIIHCPTQKNVLGEYVQIREAQILLPSIPLLV